MLVVTTPHLEGRPVRQYLGLVSGEAILGANIFRDMFAGIRDIVGGRSAAYEKELRQAKRIALEEMEEEARELGANAVVAVDLDYETIELGSGGGMLGTTAMVGAASRGAPGRAWPPDVTRRPVEDAGRTDGRPRR